jgi:hypothetical protein
VVSSSQKIPVWGYCRCHTLLLLHHYQSSQMLFHLNHTHHQCSQVLIKFSGSSSGLCHLNENMK